MVSPPPLTQSIGQAENALRAILDRLLVGFDLDYAAWVTLSLIARGPAPLPQDQLLQHLVAALLRDPATIVTVLDMLTARELVTRPAGDPATVMLTPRGDALIHRLRQGIADVTERIYGDLPADDLFTTHRVLGIVAERAGRELGRC